MTNEHGLDATNDHKRTVTSEYGPVATTEHEAAEDPTGAVSPSHDHPDATRERLDAFDRRLTSIEAELDAVRGLLDGIDAVDEAIERRASIALAKVETLERAFDDGERGLVRERIPETVAAEPSEHADDTGSPEAVDGDVGSERIHGYDVGSAVDHSRSRATDPRSELDTAKPRTDPSESDGSLASRLRGAFR
jgi:hypothetical protein